MIVENNTPEGWMETTLGEVAHITMGQSPKSVFYNMDGKGLPFYQGVTEFNDKYVSIKKYTSKNTKVVSENSILFSVRAPVGRVNFTKKECCIGRGNAGLFMKNGNQNYLYFLLVYFERKFQDYTSGTVFTSISGKELNIVPITLPKKANEQKAIAKVLTTFDDKIELLQAQNKTLETMAQTIFAAWFGKYQIGDELPEGWRIAKVNEFVKSSIGGDYGKETIEGDYTKETICLRGTDLPDMKIGTPKKAPIRFLKASKLDRCKLENGDIVVEISGGTENQSTGRAMYINEKILSSANHPMTCVNFCRIIRPLKLEYSYFLHSLFDYLYTRKVFFNWENGTTGIKNLNLKALLEDFDLFIPKNEDSILDFNKNVRAVFNKIQTNNTQIQSLKKTRDTLLPKLMSGQIRVNNVKQTVDA